MKKIALLLLLARPAAALDVEGGTRLGGSWGAGSASKFGGSYHQSLFAGGFAGKTAVGLDLLYDTQHVAQAGDRVGVNGREVYDSKLNLGALTAYARRELKAGEKFAVSGTLGAGVYQVNVWRRCRDQIAGECVGHRRNVRVSSHNHAGVNAGLGLVWKPNEVLSVGPEFRFHQILGGGHLRRPAFFTAALLAAVKL
jgi:hypothetical protein